MCNIIYRFPNLFVLSTHQFILLYFFNEEIFFNLNSYFMFFQTCFRSNYIFQIKKEFLISQFIFISPSFIFFLALTVNIRENNFFLNMYDFLGFLIFLYFAMSLGKNTAGSLVLIFFSFSFFFYYKHSFNIRWKKLNRVNLVKFYLLA